jgi:SAM-dependent methyltransferase
MSNRPVTKKVDFDNYANDYEKLLQDQLNFFSNDRGYFSKYKACRLQKLAPDAKTILDFGAGIGLMIPALQDAFPNSQIFASDISEESLSHLASQFSNVTVIADTDLGNQKFDLILIATVLHHIAPTLRHDVMSRLSQLLSPGGRICIFEHNPYNPVTQRMVSTCPFDEDAILLKLSESINLLTGSAKLKLENKGYTLFVPPSFKILQPIEKFIEWLPLGGQYFAIGRAIE